MILRTIGKKLRRARQSDGGQEENETLVVSRFTTLPVSNKLLIRLTFHILSNLKEEAIKKFIL
ncbi:MAG: hypothetical protein PHN56_03635, partial [Candidatus Nanoarchaeia archaeon]|nr:hypothetical protein [Candidatus Nanoarchaeia archaeon]